MGKALAENYDAAKDIFERADKALGYQISKLCFEGPEDDLKQTINTQPALYITSVAAYEVAKCLGISPVCTAGHSVGEYAALYAAGAFSFEDGLKLIRSRAEFMQKAAQEKPGTMAAVLGLPPEKVLEIVDKAKDAGIVVAANYNSPIQTVISGENDAVARASEIAAESGAKRVVPLNVSGGFHSPLMQSAADSLAEVLDKTNIRNTNIPVIANYTADFEQSADAVRKNLANQITGSVRWVESVNKILDEGVEIFIELGSGNVLAGLIKKIAKGAEIYSAGDKASFDAILG